MLLCEAICCYWTKTVQPAPALCCTFFQTFLLSACNMTFKMSRTWEPVVFVAPWLPGMYVCSLERCLNRLTSFWPFDLLLSFLALYNKITLSRSVTQSLNLHGLQVTWRLLHRGYPCTRDMHEVDGVFNFTFVPSPHIHPHSQQLH